jgi:asparagine synthase (glutamine-hydrolysing)
MCGIVGILYYDKKRIVCKNQLKQMAKIVSHRGPDDDGYYIDKNVGLGFRRLSVIGLRTGHQPLCDNGNRFWITYNGEVYNYRALKKELQNIGYYFKTNSDTEVIVNLYAEYREKCVDHLRGMFSFVIWDKKNKELFGVRDRFGIKPFHYYLDHEKFIWASEIKSLSVIDGIDKELNIKSLDYYFAYGHSKPDSTIYNNVRKLPPGCYFHIKHKEDYKITIKRYWEINIRPDHGKTETYWKEKLYNTVNESVSMRMVSDVPLGAFLSGGIDSSIIVSQMAKNSVTPIKTFSIGFKERQYNELTYARDVANMYGTEHYELIVEPESIDLLPRLVEAFDEPFSDSSAIPTYYLSKYAREHVTVAISGDGGDELFAGYSSYSKMLSIYKSFCNTKFTNKFVFDPINKFLPDTIYGKGASYYYSKDKRDLGAYFTNWKDYERRKIFLPEIRNVISKNEAENYKIELIAGYDCDYISRMQILDIKSYMVDDILTKVDRASMMNSLEVRVPLLDHKVAELSFQIPSSLKIKNSIKKYILKESFKHVLPRTVLAHKKQGFAMPLKLWFKENLEDYTRDTLLNSELITNYLDKNEIEKILNYHQKGRRDYSRKIWSLIVLNEWIHQNR